MKFVIVWLRGIEVITNSPGLVVVKLGVGIVCKKLGFFDLIGCINSGSGPIENEIGWLGSVAMKEKRKVRKRKRKKPSASAKSQV